MTKITQKQEKYTILYWTVVVQAEIIEINQIWAHLVNLSHRDSL